jgi:antitoxin (DNA-binding transcriptional repressor) of toxin-antitoxin stability system
MDKIVSLKELRENMPKYESRIARGASYIVVKRSKPIFRISPVDNEEEWETVIDFTKIKKGGVTLDEAMEALKKLK